MALIAEAMGIPNAEDLENVLAGLAHTFAWQEVPHYTSPAAAPAAAPSAPPAQIGAGRLHQLTTTPVESAQTWRTSRGEPAGPPVTAPVLMLKVAPWQLQ